jgi:hypothetical protein
LCLLRHVHNKKYVRPQPVSKAQTGVTGGDMTEWDSTRASPRKVLRTM